MDELQPCDVFLSASSSWLGRAIRWATRSKGEARTKANHVGMITSWGRMGDAQCVEALGRVKCHSFWDKYHLSNSRVAIYRPINITEDQRLIMVDEASKHCGEKYGWWKLLFHLEEKITGKRTWANRLFIRRRPICSFLVGIIFAKADLHFGMKGTALTPDDIMDFIEVNPEKYKLVRPMMYL